MKINSSINKIKSNLPSYGIVTVVGWFSKIVFIILSLVNLRLLVELIGVSGFGVLSFTANLIPFLALINLGIPLALQNEISKRRANQESYEGLIAFANRATNGLLLIALFICSATLFLIHFQPTLNQLNICVLFCILFLLCLNGVSEIYSRVLYAVHRGYWSNLVPTMSLTLSTIFILFLLYFEVNDLGIVLITYFCPSLFALFFLRKMANRHGGQTDNHSIVYFTAFLRLSSGFFIFHIISLIVLKSDYFIVGLLFEADELGLYSIVQRYLATPLALYAVALAAVWPNLTEGMKVKDFAKVHKLVSINMGLGFIISTFFILMFVFFQQQIIFIATGGSLEIPFSLVVSGFIYLLLRVVTDILATYILAIGYIKTLNYIVVVQAFFSIFLQYFFCIYFGLAGIFWGLSLALLLTSGWLLPVWYFSTIKDRN